MQGHCIDQFTPMQTNMEHLVASDHFLRKVDHYLNLEFIRPMTQPFYAQKKGRPSIDPEIFFRIILVGYFYNIKSHRQLCDNITYNLAYRLFCKVPLNCRVPHHSSLSRIRDRFGEQIFQEFFYKIIQVCQGQGLVTGTKLMTDATFIDAHASLKSLRLKKEEKDLQTVFKQKGYGPPLIRKISNKTHQSMTDPEASLAFKAGAAQSLKYKNHLTVDEKHRIIVDCYITTGAYHESQNYIHRLKSIHHIFNWTIKEVTADRAYGTGENLDALKGMKIKSYIPLFNDRCGTALQEGFVYEPEFNRYQCSAGKYLLLNSSADSDRKTYNAKVKDCQNCALKSPCLKNSKSKYKRLQIGQHQELFDQVKQHMKQQFFLKKLSERFWKMEGLISEAKNCHGLKRAKYRGRSKMQIQAYLISTVQNIKRFIKALERQCPMAS